MHNSCSRLNKSKPFLINSSKFFLNICIAAVYSKLKKVLNLTEQQNQIKSKFKLEKKLSRL